MSVYKDTVGFTLNLTVTDLGTGAPIDISVSNGALALSVTKPNGVAATWLPSIVSGPAGLASYATVTGNLDQVGTYTIIPQWDPTGDSVYWAEPICLTVRDR
jgi:hypothetical protein